MIKYYSFAGVNLCVTTEAGEAFEDKRALSIFETEKLFNCHHFAIRKVQKLDSPVGTCVYEGHNSMIFHHQRGVIRYIGNIANGWENAGIRVVDSDLEHLMQVNTCVYREGISEKAVLNALGVEDLVVQANGFILHASYIIWNGKGILFTAPSETGKSTQAELWKKFRGARIVNGDRAVVRMVDGTASVWGFPFAGSSQYCSNHAAPLAAIVYLSQAKETTIQKVRGYQGFRRIWEGVNVNPWDRDHVARASQIAEQILEQVPVYHLACTPDESAVEALEQMLMK